MRPVLTLLMTGAALAAAPAFAQLDVGGNVDVGVDGNVGVGGNVGVDTGPVVDSTADTVDRATDRLGETVERTDRAANAAADTPGLTLATRNDVTAGLVVKDQDGNEIGAVQRVEDDNALVLRGGQTYSIPLASLYTRATGVAEGLVTTIPSARFDAAARADVEADAEAGG